MFVCIFVLYNNHLIFLLVWKHYPCILNSLLSKPPRTLPTYPPTCPKCPCQAWHLTWRRWWKKGKRLWMQELCCCCCWDLLYRQVWSYKIACVNINRSGWERKKRARQTSAGNRLKWFLTVQRGILRPMKSNTEKKFSQRFSLLPQNHRSKYLSVKYIYFCLHYFLFCSFIYLFSYIPLISVISEFFFKYLNCPWGSVKLHCIAALVRV